MKRRFLGWSLVAILIAVVVLPSAHASILTVATLQPDQNDVSTGFCFATCITGNSHGAGVCFHSPIAFLGQPTVSAQLSVASGTAQGTFQAGIYLPAVGSEPLTGSCQPPILPPLAMSTTIPVSLSTATPSSFVFQFPYPISVTFNETLMIIFWANNTSAGAATDYRQANSGTGATPVWSQQRFEQFKNGVWKSNGGTCDTGGVGGVCPVYTFTEAPFSTATLNPPPSQPVFYGCCNPVSQQSLQGSALRAPDVDPGPFYLLFIVLFMLTLGSYIVVNSVTQNMRNPRQYEINLGV